MGALNMSTDSMPDINIVYKNPKPTMSKEELDNFLSKLREDKKILRRKRQQRYSQLLGIKTLRTTLQNL